MASAPRPHSSAGWKRKRTVPSKPPLGGEDLRRAEQHGGVAVVAAGVHQPGVPGAVGAVPQLLDAERVHVGAERDRAAGGAAAQRTDDADPTDPLDDLVEPETPELVGDERGGARSARTRTRGGRGGRAARPSSRRRRTEAWCSCVVSPRNRTFGRDEQDAAAPVDAELAGGRRPWRGGEKAGQARRAGRGGGGTAARRERRHRIGQRRPRRR